MATNAGVTYQINIDKKMAYSKGINTNFHAMLITETPKAALVWTQHNIKLWIPKYAIKEMKIEQDESKWIKRDDPPQKKKEARIKEYHIDLFFDYDESLILKIKTIEDYFYIRETHHWQVPNTPINLESIKKWGFTTIDQRILRPKKTEKKPLDKIDGFTGTLLPFQEEGVQFLLDHDGKAILGDDMGLGKTIQAICYVQAAQKFPTIIVCPSSLKGNWENEIRKWVPKATIEILYGKKSSKIVKGKKFYIINYDVIQHWYQEIIDLKPEQMILDECHYIKNSRALRTKAIKMIAKHIPNILPISGTPVINRPIELYNTINLIHPNLFPNMMQYAKKYCNAHHTGFGWDFSGASNLEELYSIVSNFMIRRTKNEVLTELPEKRRSFIPMELSNQKEYTRARYNFLSWIRETKGEKAMKRAENAQTLAQIGQLRQLAVKGALQNSLQWIEDFLCSDEKLVVFAIHSEIIDAIMEKFNGICVKIDGSIPSSKRQAIVEEFQTNKNIRLFVGNINAAGVGLTLTAASNIAFLELPWSPGELVQAEDRCHRIGQKNAVTINYLIPKDTIEETLAEIMHHKTHIIAKTVDGEISDSTEMLKLLFEQISAI